MPGGVLNARKQRVFESVFGGADNSQPTPVATPAAGFTTPGRIFGGPFLANHHSYPAHLPRTRGPSLQQGNSLDASDHVQDQVKWDRSWHLVTHTLALSDFPENRVVLESLKPERESLSAEFYVAVENILYPQVYLPFARQTEDIVAWHTSQVRNHFLQQVLPLILRLRDEYVPEALLIKVVKILETAHRQYLHGLSFIKEQIDNSVPDTSTPVVERFRRDLFAIISNSVTESLSDALTKVLKVHVHKILGLAAINGASNFVIAAEGVESEKARREMLVLVESFKNVGLAGERFQVIFAEIMNRSMTDYISRGCRGVWSPDDMAKHSIFDDDTRSRTDRHGSILAKTAPHSPLSRCVSDLCQWVEERYAKLAVQVLSLLDAKVKVTWAHKEKYKEMAMGRLADLRTRELFDIVASWPQSTGALDDLRTAITTPQRRLHLTEVFAKTLSRRILHPGASTLLVLQTYISMIWSFHALDHSKVLLDRVAYPLQLYLCSREDTVRIIITGLLSDVEDSQSDSIRSGGDKLVELAKLLSKGSEQNGQRVNDEELDWHDMEWIPDPVDAGPGYRRSKNADIIGTLIGVLGSQDLFIKEFQNIIGENLLKHEGSFEKEVKVLELLKVRFGEAPLQACEVMLKDIQDSGRVDGVIRRNQKLDPSEEEIGAARANPDMVDENLNPEGLFKPSLHAKILSRLFWPQLHDEGYRIPDDIAKLQRRYEEGFESLKASRKLTWLQALGQATVELELGDRTIVEEVHTWQATVIWAFQNEEAAPVGLTKTVHELVQSLEMDETLVRGALRFWVNKLVLHEISPNTFAVLETLNQEDRERSNAQAAASAASGTHDESADDVGLAGNDGIGKEKMGMYWQFIQSMLTNSSSQMPLQQIAMMLKVLIVDGFPYSNEELQELLERKVVEGKLELVGGKYKLKK